jgi:hypothetical protein
LISIILSQIRQCRQEPQEPERQPAQEDPPDAEEGELPRPMEKGANSFFALPRHLGQASGSSAEGLTNFSKPNPQPSQR